MSFEVLITKLYAANEQFRLLNDVERYIRHEYDKYSNPIQMSVPVPIEVSREEKKKKRVDQEITTIKDSRVHKLIKILARVNGTRRLTPEQISEEYDELIRKENQEQKRKDVMDSNDIISLCELYEKNIFIVYKNESLVIISLRPSAHQSFFRDHQIILQTIDKIFNIAVGNYINCDKGYGLSFDMLRVMYKERFKETLMPLSDTKLADLLRTYADKNIKVMDKYQILVRHSRKETYLAESTIKNEILLDRIYKIIEKFGPLPLVGIHYNYTRK